MVGYDIAIENQARNRIAFGTNNLIQRKGIFYMVGRDVNYRPILVVNV